MLCTHFGSQWAVPTHPMECSITGSHCALSAVPLCAALPQPSFPPPNTTKPPNPPRGRNLFLFLYIFSAAAEDRSELILHNPPFLWEAGAPGGGWIRRGPHSGCSVLRAHGIQQPKPPSPSNFPALPLCDSLLLGFEGQSFGSWMGLGAFCPPDGMCLRGWDPTPWELSLEATVGKQRSVGCKNTI